MVFVGGRSGNTFAKAKLQIDVIKVAVDIVVAKKSQYAQPVVAAQISLTQSVAAQPPVSAMAPTSTENRLNKLKEVLDQNLFTKDEYDTQRKKILDSM